jgi:hypothetical protein
MIDVGTNNEKLLKDPLCKILVDISSPGFTLQYLFVHHILSFVFTYFSYETMWSLSKHEVKEHVANVITFYVF